MRCVIFGAGKIARGFIGHLLYLSDIPFTFVEKADALADLINERGQYTVNILGAPEKNCVVKGAKALKFDQKEEIAEAIAEADAVFNAVGGKNLGDIVPFLTAGIEKKAKKGGKLNFVTCENWKKPADILRDGIAAAISEEARPYFEENVGITEAVIMRSAIESDAELLKKDPLIVNVQNFWELPVDASRLKGELPPIQGLKLIAEFTGFLERKFYTYNAANGTVSYLGGLLGYEKIADAAHDEWILKILDGVYSETARALSAKHNFPWTSSWPLPSPPSASCRTTPSWTSSSAMHAIPCASWVPTTVWSARRDWWRALASSPRIWPPPLPPPSITSPPVTSSPWSLADCATSAASTIFWKTSASWIPRATLPCW